MLVGTGAYAALVCLVRNRGDVVSNFLGVEWITNIERAYARIEVRDENDPPIVDGREIFIARMCAEPSAAAAEVAARFRDGPAAHAERL